MVLSRKNTKHNHELQTNDYGFSLLAPAITQRGKSRSQRTVNQTQAASVKSGARNTKRRGTASANGKTFVTRAPNAAVGYLM